MGPAASGPGSQAGPTCICLLQPPVLAYKIGAPESPATCEVRKVPMPRHSSPSPLCAPSLCPIPATMATELWVNRCPCCSSRNLVHTWLSPCYATLTDPHSQCGSVYHRSPWQLRHVDTQSPPCQEPSPRSVNTSWYCQVTHPECS